MLNGLFSYLIAYCENLSYGILMKFFKKKINAALYRQYVFIYLFFF